MTVIPIHSRIRPLPDPQAAAWAAGWTESQLFARWIQACNERDVLWFHVYSGVFAAYGFPDLVLAGPGGVAFVELKSSCGTLSPQQEVWRRTLLDAEARYSVHTPADWVSGASIQLLDSLAADAGLECAA